LSSANFEVPAVKNGDDSDVDNVIAFGFDWSRPAKLADRRLHGSYPRTGFWEITSACRAVSTDDFR